MTVSVKRIAQKKCIVRKLAVLEVLGKVTDICSDKTGTLTENKMVVKKAVIGVDEIYLVTGAPYDVHGDFQLTTSGSPASSCIANEPLNMSHLYPDHPYIYEYLRCAALCSTTILHLSEEDMDMLAGSGNPTEVAIQAMT
uniref:Cation-transporting ATPase pma1 n=1 Tax=Lygus hesperus TaxID=30085 RepID=A0A0A9YX23_LYGHE